MKKRKTKSQRRRRASKPVDQTRLTQPAEKTVNWPLEKIRPYPNNPRTHNDEQIRALAALMLKYGIDQPIVVDEDGIILKGHGRRIAAFTAGFSSYPVVIRKGLSEDDKKALRIADNQVALLAGWNQDLIKIEVGSLSLAGYDMPLLAFPERELARLTGDGEDEAALPQLEGLSYAVVIRCKTERDQKGLLERFEKEGLMVEALIS